LLVKRWVKQEACQVLKALLCSELNLSPATANILVNRGIKSKEEAGAFLNAPLSDLHDPFLFAGIDKVVARVLKAIRSGEKILVYGDYDADGITSTALLVEFFRDIGKDVLYYIPKRLEDGYGLSLDSLKRIKEKGVTLIITVDCGISSVIEVEAAANMGMDVIITDHHEAPDVIPDAYAIVNPCLKRSCYPFMSLAGVGVALKLAQAIKAGLDGKDSAGPGIDPSLIKYLDLVALGTIADVVPLTGENRVLVKHGLRVMNEGMRSGIRALKEVASIKGKISSGIVAFQVAPRLNASGRLSQAEAGVRLLITDDPDEASKVAAELDAMNRERQKIEEEILEEARYILTSSYDSDSRTIVLASDRWHQGVIGVVASKLVEEFYKPTVLISLSDSMGKGSARSIPSFHLYKVLARCGLYLEGFGGHKYAAGLSIKQDMIEPFRREFEATALNTLTEDDFRPSLRIDAEVPLCDVGWELHGELSSLGPFGAGNPEPVLQASGLGVLYPKVVGKNHVRMVVTQGGLRFGSIGFNMGSIYQSLAMKNVTVDAAFSLNVNEWQGERTLQLNLKDLHY